MSETILATAATVAAGDPSTAYSSAVSGDLMRFRVDMDVDYSVSFYGSDSSFSDEANAAILHGTSIPGLAATSGDGESFIVDAQGWGYVGIVVTNTSESEGTLSVGVGSAYLDGVATLQSLASYLAAGIAGTGTVLWEYTLTDDYDQSIPGASIWVTSDVTGTNVVATGTTNYDGVVSFRLNTGTVYIWAQKSGWNFDNPDTEVVA